MTAAGFVSARPKERLLLRGARQVVTLQGPPRLRHGAELREIGLLRDASILIEGGVIAQVGSSRRVDNLKEAATARVVDLRNLVIVPGFLDAVHDLLPVREISGDGADAANAAAPGYSDRILHTITRRLERELGRLAQLGTTFAQFRLRFPDEAVLQSRLLRNLLQLDFPRESFRADLHFHHLPHFDTEGAETLAGHLSRAARGFWKSLEGSLAVSVRAAALESLSTSEQLRALRRIGGGLPCYLTQPDPTAAEHMAALCVGSGSTVVGRPPQQEATLAMLAQHEVPWIVPSGEYGVEMGWGNLALRRMIDSGMRLALSSGFNVNRPGSASTFALSSILRNEEKLEPEEILQLSIANLVFALGLGHRLGCIQAGYEANLSILECEDYREIGLHAGMPPILASFRRGVLMEKRLTMRS
ncbi:MAG: hypothetical protein U5J83_16965 [Bryobacterales bacterium]|nr:hypothetical protein [Bryobacterales bacterium]